MNGMTLKEFGLKEKPHSKAMLNMDRYKSSRKKKNSRGDFRMIPKEERLSNMQSASKRKLSTFSKVVLINDVWRNSQIPPPKKNKKRN